MSAQPVHEHDPQDPQAILRQLPDQARPRFLAEYRAAVDRARDPAGYHDLRELLRTWSLLAAAYTSPGFLDRCQDVRDGTGQYVVMDEVLPHSGA